MQDIGSLIQALLIVPAHNVHEHLLTREHVLNEARNPVRHKVQHVQLACVALARHELLKAPVPRDLAILQLLIVLFVCRNVKRPENIVMKDG